MRAFPTRLSHRAAAALEAASHAPEPIPTIQPHGALLAIRCGGPDDVVAASSNAAAVLWGSALPPRKVVGRGLADIVGSRLAADIQARREDGRLRTEAPWQSTLKLDAQTLDVSVHRHGGLIHVELEPSHPQDAADAQTAMQRLHDLMLDLRRTGADLEALVRITAQGIRLLTGYERVVLYKFDGEWHGQTICEDAANDWDAAPAGLLPSGTPVLACEPNRRSPMHWVLDRDAVPVPLEFDPTWPDEWRRAAAVDLSFANLRIQSSAAPRTHRDQDINGTMSLAIQYGNRPWGLILCQHRQPHRPSPAQRSAAATLAEAFALCIEPVETANTDQARRAALRRMSALLAHVATADGVKAALTTGDVTVADLFASTGAAVLYDGTISLLGRTPAAFEVRALAHWLQGRCSATKLYQTNKLAAVYPPWQQHEAIAGGVLAIFLSADGADALLWFRPREPERGNSRSTAYKTAAPSRHEPWIGTQRGFARPWENWELEMAETLRHAIAEVMIRGLHRIGQLSETLRQSQKMAAVGQLTGGIAHDFNNLLAAILGSLEMSRARASEGRFGELKEYLGAAATSAERAASLTHRLLAFSRRQTLDAITVDVARLMHSMTDLITRSVGPAIQVETVISDDLWQTLCDASQLENVLLNLAINARDAMPDGGRLSVGAANIRLDKTFARGHPDVAPGEYVAIFVTDTGAGMAPGIIAQIFEPFFTTKPPGRGTGLGLSMVHDFAKHCKGSVDIDSEPGQGTTVRVYLPCAIERPGRQTRQPKPLPEVAAAAGKTVLLVEDEPILRKLLGEMLRDLGYRVSEAADAATGLRVLQSSQEVDLMVSDIGLPGGMDGRQLADAAVGLRARLKILFITGYAENEMLDGALKPNMQVVTKPFPLQLLAAKIRDLI